MTGSDRASCPASLPPGVSEEATLTAQLFASVAARGASLVERAHAQLDALQLREQDPQRLAALFGLDHLAAQLRRNSNAALVLAGLPTIRSIPVPTLLSELVYAAVCEVDGYQRVTVGAFPTRRVRPDVASDLVHLLGDLLENALAVSPRAGGVWCGDEVVVRLHVADPARAAWARMPFTRQTVGGDVVAGGGSAWAIIPLPFLINRRRQLGGLRRPCPMGGSRRRGHAGSRLDGQRSALWRLYLRRG
jgi:hypothetical protein